jgi:hypothetical protein
MQRSKASRVQENQCAVLTILEQSFYSFSMIQFAVVVQSNEVVFFTCTY